VIWHLGYTEAASAVAFTQSYPKLPLLLSRKYVL
jgi:hypothetical protein